MNPEDRRVIQGSSPWIVNTAGNTVFVFMPGVSTNCTIVGGSVHIEATLEIRGESINATVTNWDGIRGESINAHVSDFTAIRGESINSTITNWEGIRGESINVTMVGGSIHIEATAEIVGASVNAHVSDFTAMRGESINVTIPDWSGIRGESINVTVAGGSIHVEATAEVTGASLNATVTNWNGIRGESINANVSDFSAMRGESINVTVAGGSIHVEATAEVMGASLNATVTNWNGIRGESVNATITNWEGASGDARTVHQGTSPWLTQISDAITTAKVDAIGQALVSMPFEHHKVHDERMYRASYLATDVADDGVEELLIETGGDAVHTIFSIESEGIGWINLYEGPTIASLGSTIASINMNRDGGASSLSSVHIGVTITNTGTTLSSNFIKGGEKNFKVGGGARDGNEWVLKADENYLMRFTNRSGSSADVALSTEYYEVD